MSFDLTVVLMTVCKQICAIYIIYYVYNDVHTKRWMRDLLAKQVTNTGSFLMHLRIQKRVTVTARLYYAQNHADVGK